MPEKELETKVALIESEMESIWADVRELKELAMAQGRDIAGLHEEKVEMKVDIKGIHESIGDLRDKYQCWQETHSACQAEKIRLLQDSCVKKGNGSITEFAQATNLLNQGWFKILMELLKILLVVAGVKLVGGM